MKELENSIAALLAIALLSVLLVVWWPLAVVWSLNTLFQTEIPYSFKTWVAVVVIVTFIRVSTISSEKR